MLPGLLGSLSQGGRKIVGGMGKNLWGKKGKPLFSFGVISDIQYANKPVTLGRNRYEKDAINKLHHSLHHWSKYHTSAQPLKCVVNLGDIIDAHQGPNAAEKDQADLQRVLRAFDTLPIPQYHVLGNHCVWNLGCEYLEKELRMPRRFYDVEIEQGWRFVFLDGTDLSLMKDSHSLAEAKEYVKLNSHRMLEEWNGGFGTTQIQWLKKIFSRAKQNGEKLILFCHWPLVNSWTSEFESSLLWNSEEVLSTLDPEVVFMFMSGHIHENGYRLHNSIHHITLGGVVTTPVGDHAHAVVHVHPEGVEVEGFGAVSPLSVSLPFERSRDDLSIFMHTVVEHVACL